MSWFVGVVPRIRSFGEEITLSASPDCTGTTWVLVLLLTRVSFVLGVNSFVYAVSIVRYGASYIVYHDGWGKVLFCISF